MGWQCDFRAPLSCYFEFQQGCYLRFHLARSVTPGRSIGIFQGWPANHVPQKTSNIGNTESAKSAPTMFWASQCQNGRSVVSRSILIPAARRAWLSQVRRLRDLLQLLGRDDRQRGKLIDSAFACRVLWSLLPEFANLDCGWRTHGSGCLLLRPLLRMRVLRAAGEAGTGEADTPRAVVGQLH